MVYRFRVAYEEHEDVYRDIDIKASQTFNDLHYIIQQSISFDNSKPYSFFISDGYWRREKEIPLGNKYDEKEKINRSKNEVSSPKRKVIADFVNDPHQKFIYVFDPYKEWVFLIELIKILPAENKAYPICVKSMGTSPKQYKETNLPSPPEDDDEEIKILKDEKEVIVEPGEEKISEDDDVEGLLPFKDEEADTGEEKEKPSDEDEEGESSDGFDMDDEE